MLRIIRWVVTAVVLRPAQGVYDEYLDLTVLPYTIHASPRLFGFPCWVVPIVSGIVWLTTLLAMLIAWTFKGNPRYPQMPPNQSLAYISDLGATVWGKPLFITGSAITVITFGASFAAERWLRHRGLLIHASSPWSATYSASATFFTILGASGLMLLTIFDVRHHVNIHDPMIGVFIGGYICAACFLCLEKRLIASKFPNNTLLRRSFRIKAFFIVWQVTLSSIFGLTALSNILNPSVVVEWLISLFFAFYMWSFALDFLPVPGVTADGVVRLRDVDCIEKMERDLTGHPEESWEDTNHGAGIGNREKSASFSGNWGRREATSKRRMTTVTMDETLPPTGTKEYIKIP